ncbi:hypothetical protein APS56_01780 [Pseudalgibacter alginicilyticus]|uniref:DUF3822 domain-containing protein n=1 Tax=Pseudalgibacter alginicilyticus TaxID=1736674 RepID=A0A0P0D829_9FLAO|nr:DUF3822 family protein [Pseudalgibacter alginicilyticus]ALJ03957.1 hypothetical protein APS56_01780 [Pseudalgibacter alginicilyticus]
MVVTNNNSEHTPNNKELSIQISLNGLSFCILQSETNTISFLKNFSFDKKQSPFETLNQLKSIFETEDQLNDNFTSICVIHVNELSVLVPKPLFSEAALADYLKFNTKILKSDFITYDNIPCNDSVNVYVPYVNINNYIYDKFGTFTFKHFSTVLVEQILLIEKNSETQKVYAHMASNHFEIVIVNKGSLLLYNTFEYSTSEDFIYYLLFAAEQLGLNPEVCELVFLGDIVKDDAIYTIAYKYIRHVSFGNRFDNYKYLTAPKTNYSDFTLIKSF